MSDLGRVFLSHRYKCSYHNGKIEKECCVPEEAEAGVQGRPDRLSRLVDVNGRTDDPLSV